MILGRITAAQQLRRPPGFGHGGTHIPRLAGELSHSVINHFGEQETIGANGWLLHAFIPTRGVITCTSVNRSGLLPC